MSGFIEFVRKQGIVGLAVGFVLGAAVSKLVAAVVADIVNPVVGLALGKGAGIASSTLSVGGAEILYGHLITSFIDFAIIALVVYFAVTKLGLDKLDKKEENK